MPARSGRGTSDGAQLANPMSARSGRLPGRPLLVVPGVVGVVIGLAALVGVPVWYMKVGPGADGGMVPFWVRALVRGSAGVIGLSLAALLLGVPTPWVQAPWRVVRAGRAALCGLLLVAGAVAWLEPVAPLFTGDLSLGLPGPAGSTAGEAVEPPPRQWTKGLKKKLAWRAGGHELMLEMHEYDARHRARGTVTTRLSGRWVVAGEKLVDGLGRDWRGRLSVESLERASDEVPGSGVGGPRVTAVNQGGALRIESGGAVTHVMQRIDLGQGMHAMKVMWLTGQKRLVCHARWRERRGLARVVKRLLHRSAADVLLLVDAETGATSRLVTRFYLPIGQTDCSPDGRWVAFDTPILWWRDDGLGPWSRVFVLHIGDRRLVPLSEGSVDADGPVWSPDGRWVAFWGWSGGSTTPRPWVARVADWDSGDTSLNY